MFSKYWRTYPWWLQLILFILMIFTLAFFFIAITSVVVPGLMGMDISRLSNITEKSPVQFINGALLAQALAAIGTFILPALIFAYVTTPRPAAYLGLRKSGKSIHWVLVILVMLGGIPLFLFIGELFKNVDLGKGARELQTQNDNAIKAFLTMNSPMEFLRSFFVLAILAPLGEELTFRGVFMRFAAKRTHRIAFSIVLSAILFAGMHSNFSGMVAIFLAGVLLGVIYYLTGSLWCSILGHLVHNGLQIIIVYAAKDNEAVKTVMNSNSLPPSITAVAAAVFCIALWLLFKYKTPLPDNWTDDYTKEELIENAG